MPGVALSGPIGAGKSTVQRLLMAEHGFWTPLNYTTRDVSAFEVEASQVASSDFVAQVKAGDLVLPQVFAGIWYAWSARDFELLTRPEVKAVVNVRPYTALVLAACIKNFFPVWLYAQPDELNRRRLTRGEARDAGEISQDRIAADATDQQFAAMFGHQVLSDEGAVASILALLEAVQ